MALPRTMNLRPLDSPPGPILQPIQVQQRAPCALQPGSNLVRFEWVIARSQIAVDYLCDFFSRAGLFYFIQGSQNILVQVLAGVQIVNQCLLP